MYISAQMTPNMKEVIVWERTKAGRVTKRYPAPYYFYLQDSEGKYKDIHGNKIILMGQHAFEWSIVKEADGKIVITSFPNRTLAQQEFNKLKI